MKSTNQFDISIIGGGPLGLALAHCLVTLSPKLNIAILTGEPRPAGGKNQSQRAIAIMSPAMDYLETISGLDIRANGHTYGFKGMRLVDVSKSLFHAPELFFDPEEIGLDSFAFAINDDILVNLLLEKLKQRPIHIVQKNVKMIHKNQIHGRHCLQTEDGNEIYSSIILAADGRFSPTRSRFDFPSQIKNFDHSVYTANFSASQSLNRISTEFYTEDGLFTLVPISEKRVNVIALMKDITAEQTSSWSTYDIEQWAMKQSHGLCGKMTLEAPAQLIKLSSIENPLIYKDNVFLVGDAAHAFPPIGAQGFNLGFRDVLTLGSLFYKLRPSDINDGAKITKMSQEYQINRLKDIQARQFAVSTLSFSVLSRNMVSNVIRKGSIGILKYAGPARKIAMNFGLGDWKQWQNIEQIKT